MLKIEKTTTYKNFKAWVLPIILSLMFVRFLNTFVFIVAYIPSASMRDTLIEGDKVLCINPFFIEKLERGDIVVFTPKDDDAKRAGSDGYWIKRIIGVPGDKVRIEAGKVYINGELQDESYVTYNEDYTGSFVIQEGKYLVLGDNRADSFDGRKWTNPYIDKSQIKFKAILKLYPFNKITKL